MISSTRKVRASFSSEREKRLIYKDKLLIYCFIYTFFRKEPPPVIDAQIFKQILIVCVKHPRREISSAHRLLLPRIYLGICASTIARRASRLFFHTCFSNVAALRPRITYENDKFSLFYTVLMIVGCR